MLIGPSLFILRTHPSAQSFSQAQIFAIVDRASHDSRHRLAERILEHRLKILRRCNAITAAAEGLRQRGKIRVAEINEGRPPVTLKLFPLNDAVAGIFEDERDKINPSTHCRLEFLRAHEKAAVTAGRKHAPLGVNQLRADGAWKRDAH